MGPEALYSPNCVGRAPSEIEFDAF